MTLDMTTPHTSSAPSLDQEIATQLQDLMPDQFAMLMQQYLDMAAEVLKQLDHAVAQSDAELLVRQSHSLKSASAQVGAMRMSEIMRALEESGGAEITGPAIAAQLEAAKQELVTLEPLLQRMMG